MIIIINVCFICSFPVYGVTQINDDKIIDINSNFVDDSVLVVLTKEYSEIEVDYKDTIFWFFLEIQLNNSLLTMKKENIDFSK